MITVSSFQLPSRKNIITYQRESPGMFHRLKHMMLKAKLIELGFYYSLQLPERKAWRRQTFVRGAQFDERQ